jgi:hypothetical protein
MFKWMSRIFSKECPYREECQNYERDSIYCETLDHHYCGKWRSWDEVNKIIRKDSNE